MICEATARSFIHLDTPNSSKKKYMVILTELLATVFKYGISMSKDEQKGLLFYFARNDCVNYNDQLRSALSYFQKYAGIIYFFYSF